MSYLPAVVSVAVIGNYRLRAKVNVDMDAATVVWPNGVELAPERLYEEARKNPLGAA